MPPSDRGRPADDVLAELDAFRTNDVRWREGRAFTLTYFAGEEVTRLQEQAYAAYLSENGLNTDAFPSLKAIQPDVVATVSGWLNGGSTAAGFMTSGGTESLLLAVRAARERGRIERNILEPQMVLPTSAHAAFEKAADYFGVRSVRVPVGADWRADPAAMEAAVTPNTVLLVASAPQYPQGVIDPVAAIAGIAGRLGIPCHVDACMGGVTLPFLERLGEPIAPWDFRVAGVTSISVDLHKFGYTAKGASVLLHRSKALRNYQTFVTDNWLGGLYGSSGIMGTKSGGAMAAAWAVLHHVGADGYLELTRKARAATLELAAGIEATPGLELRATPACTLVSFGTSKGAGIDIFAVADQLWHDHGWYLDRQGPPDSLHCTVNAVHDGKIATFLHDLRSVLSAIGGQEGSRGAYGTVE
jgi:sphinganine-1-phosphate aldolase